MGVDVRRDDGDKERPSLLVDEEPGQDSFPTEPHDGVGSDFGLVALDDVEVGWQTVCMNLCYRVWNALGNKLLPNNTT